jgi:hypothetical protein
MLFRGSRSREILQPVHADIAGVGSSPVRTWRANRATRVQLPSTDEGDLGSRPAATSPPRTPRRGRTVLIIARTALGIGLIAYLALSGAIDWARLLGLATAWHLTAAAFVLLFLVVLLCSWRLCILLAGQGLALSISASLRLSLIGGLFNNVLPGSNGGDVVRFYLAARPNAGRRAEIATTLVIDRVIGLLALLIAPLLIAAVPGAQVRGNMALNGLVIVAALGSIALIAGLALSGRRDSRFRRLAIALSGRVRLGEQLQRVFDSAAAHARNRLVLMGALAVSVLVQVLVICSIQLILLANGSPSPSWGAALLTPIGMLANALPLTPGGLGVGEASFDALFRFAGTAGGAEAILSWRLLTTLIDLGGGAILLVGRTEMKMMRKLAASTAVASAPPRDARPGARGGTP